MYIVQSLYTPQTKIPFMVGAVIRVITFLCVAAYTEGLNDLHTVISSVSANGYFKTIMQVYQTSDFVYGPLVLYGITSFQILFDDGLYLMTPILSIITLVLADVYILYILQKLHFDTHKNNIIHYVWLSPVWIYAIYGLSAFDVITIALFLGALNFLFKQQFWHMAVLLGCAAGTQTSILIVLPFIGIYLYRHQYNLHRILSIFMVICGTVILIYLPVIDDYIFWQSMLAGKGQGQLLNAQLNMSNITLYALPMAYILLLFKAMSIEHYNRTMTMMFFGFAFGIVILLTPQLLIKYVWLLPFLSFFFIKENYFYHPLYGLLQVTIVVYFGTVYMTDMYAMPAIVTNLSATALQTLLVLNCFWMYQHGLTKYCNQKLFYRPFILGIGGDSGTGKSTLAHTLSTLFTPMLTQVFCGDAMHKWERNNSNYNIFTHLNPKANNLYVDMKFLYGLKNRKILYRRQYDHDTGQFTKDFKIRPSNLNIFEGLHAFSLPQFNKIYDLKIFIAPEKKVYQHWKIRRDMVKRGYTKKQVLENIQSRYADSQKYIAPQQVHADIVIKPYFVTAVTELGGTDPFEIGYQFILNADIDMENIIDILSVMDTLCVHHEYISNTQQSLSLSGYGCANTIYKGLSDMQKTFVEIGVERVDFPSGLSGIVSLIIVQTIFQKTEAHYV